jgi:hypothetical protein
VFFAFQREGWFLYCEVAKLGFDLLNLTYFRNGCRFKGLVTFLRKMSLKGDGIGEVSKYILEYSTQDLVCDGIKNGCCYLDISHMQSWKNPQD